MRRGILLLGLPVVGFALWWARRTNEPGASKGVPASLTREDPRASMRKVSRESESAVGGSSAQRPQRRLNEEARRKLLGAIAAARAQRAARNDVGTLDKEYIQAQVRKLIPLEKECFDDRLRVRPGLEGKLVVRFLLGGEPGVGGVVEESEILPESTIDDPLLRECIIQTVYAVELPAPERGGRIEIIYPIELRPGD